MKNFCLNICQVEEILKRRFKISPRAIEPWESSIQFDFTELAPSSNRFTWRYNDFIQTSGVVLSTIDKPFFYGILNLDIFKDAGLPVNVNGYRVDIKDYFIDSITNLYNVSLHVLKSYGDNTVFIGDVPPGIGQNETLDKIRFDHPVVSPYLDVTTQVDATGKLYLKMKATFSGFRIYMS